MPNVQIPEIPNPEYYMPPPPLRPGNWYLFDFYVGQKVQTIWGESGTIERCAVDRSGSRYYVQTGMNEAAWLHYDQIVDDRWIPGPGPMPYGTMDDVDAGEPAIK